LIQKREREKRGGNLFMLGITEINGRVNQVG